MPNNNEVARLLHIKAALQSVTASQGWAVIKGILANMVERSKEAAIDEADKEKREYLTIKAKATKDVVNDLITTIEQTKQFDTDDEPDWFTELCYQAGPEEIIID